MTQLTNQEKEKIAELLNITKSIGNIYQVLSSFEKDGKTNSLEYEKYLSYLNIAKEVEEEYYEDLKGNREKCIELFYYLYEKNTDILLLSQEEKMVQRDYEELHIQRIFNILKSLIATALKHEFDLFVYSIKKRYKTLKNLNDIIEYKKELSKKNINLNFENNIIRIDLNNDSFNLLVPKRQREYLYRSEMIDPSNINNIMEDGVIKDIILEDLYMRYLINLDKEIHNKSNIHIREELIDSKYSTIFVNEKLESAILQNKLLVPSKVHISSEEICTKIFNYYPHYYDDIKSNITKSNILHQLYGLFNIFDDEYGEKSIYLLPGMELS